MSGFPYDLTGPIGHRATLGLIALQADETVEPELHHLFARPGVALYVSRVPSGAEVTTDTLAAMQAHLPAAARLLPPSLEFGAIGYACTSGATTIGADRVAALVRDAAAARHVTDPLTAAVAACDAMGIRSLALVSPYVASVADPLRAAFARGGVAVPVSVSFGEKIEARVARIDPGSIREAALSVGGAAEAEAVFLSCTNLRTFGIIDDLEQRLGKPVLASNQVLAWHMARLAGGPELPDAPGRLFRHAAGAG